MTRKAAQIYVHANSAGNSGWCRHIIQDLKEKLRPLYKQNRILGYQLLMLKCEEDAEDELVWCDYLKWTKGRYPFICAYIQPNEQEAIDIDELLSSHQFVRCPSS